MEGTQMQVVALIPDALSSNIAGMFCYDKQWLHPAPPPPQRSVLIEDL